MMGGTTLAMCWVSMTLLIDKDMTNNWNVMIATEIGIHDSRKC